MDTLQVQLILLLALPIVAGLTFLVPRRYCCPLATWLWVCSIVAGFLSIRQNIHDLRFPDNSLTQAPNVNVGWSITLLLITAVSFLQMRLPGADAKVKDRSACSRPDADI
jgi:hypothetical protein